MTKKQFKRADSPAAYEDVKYILNIALKRPGLIYECSTYGAAVHFKQRCNRYRVMLRQQAAEIDGAYEGYRPEVVYDTIVIRQVNDEGHADTKGRRLRFDRQEPLGRLIDPETGEDIEINLDDEVLRGEH